MRPERGSELADGCWEKEGTGMRGKVQEEDERTKGVRVYRRREMMQRGSSVCRDERWMESTADWDLEELVEVSYRYHQGTVRHGEFSPQNSEEEGLVEYSESDWALDESGRHSRTGVIVTYKNAPIVWTSQLQKSTATYSAEAEFS